MLENGTSQVWGPPGCGKTTFIATQVREEVDARGPNSVLVCSLTKAAATEVAGRDLPISRSQIGTLHSHAYRSFEPSPKIAEAAAGQWNEDRGKAIGLELSTRGASTDEPGWDRRSGARGDAKLAELSRLRSARIPRSSWPATVAYFASEWEAWKRESDHRDFTDLIDDALAFTPTAPGLPQVIIADEAQDLSRLEMALLDKWAARAECLLIAGDPYQCLYSFRGSDPSTFLGVDVGPGRRKVLNQSYRVPAAVRDASMRWIERHKDFVKFDYRPRDAEGEFRHTGSPWQRPHRLVDMLDDHTADVKVGSLIAASKSPKIPRLGGCDDYAEQNDRTVMVLAACSYMLAPLLKRLRVAGIPFHNPYRVKRGDWNPLRPGSGTCARLLALLRMHRSVWGRDAALWTPADIGQWIELVRAEGLLKRGAKGKIIAEAKEERQRPIAEDWMAERFLPDALRELMAAVNGGIDTAVAWLGDHALPRPAKALEFPMRVLRSRGGDALRRRPRIIVGTIHSVKGGEADDVYLFPDLSPSGDVAWRTRHRDAVVRLFYVGMTRARRSLTICPPSSDLCVEGL